MREALFSQDGWGDSNVKQDTSWDVDQTPGAVGGSGDGGPPRNDGTDLWKSTLSGQPTITEQVAGWVNSPSAQPFAHQLRTLAQQIQMAVQAGHLNPAILTQPLAPQNLILLNQLLQEVKALQQYEQQQHQNYTWSMHLKITKMNQHIVNLHNKIFAQQADYLEPIEQTQQHHPTWTSSNDCDLGEWSNSMNLDMQKRQQQEQQQQGQQQEQQQQGQQQEQQEQQEQQQQEQQQQQQQRQQQEQEQQHQQQEQQQLVSDFATMGFHADSQAPQPGEVQAQAANRCSNPAPPPPPPPALPPVNDMRSSLMGQIRAGVNLKHVEIGRDKKPDSRFANTQQRQYTGWPIWSQNSLCWHQIWSYVLYFYYK